MSDYLAKGYGLPLGLMGAYVFLWAAVSALTHYGYGLDTLELLSWGREWLMGTHKHPTLPTWILASFWYGLGDVGTYIVLPLFEMLTLCALYFLTKEFVSKERAMLSTLLVGICFSWRSFDNVFNHNSSQTLFWVLVVALFYLALRDKKMHLWILLGAAAAACMWIKYSAVFLLLCVPLWLLWNRAARENLKTAGPWVAAVVFLALFAPHLYFLMESNFLPLDYGLLRGASGRSMTLFLIAQAYTQLPLLLILAASGFFGHKLWKQSPRDEEDKFILIFAFAPVILCFIAMDIFFPERGLHTQWGYSFFTLLGLVIMRFVVPLEEEERKVKRAFYVGLTLLLATPLAHGAYLVARPYFYPSPSKLDFPQHALAKEVVRIFVETTGKPPLLVAGTVDPAGRAAIEMKDPTARFFMNINSRTAFWLDKKELCSATAIVWEGPATKWMEEKIYQMRRRCVKKERAWMSSPVQIEIPFARYPTVEPLKINIIAIVKP